MDVSEFVNVVMLAIICGLAGIVWWAWRSNNKSILDSIKEVATELRISNSNWSDIKKKQDDTARCVTATAEIVSEHDSRLVVLEADAE